MQYELIAVLCIIFCLFILGIEYLWLAVLAKQQEDKKNEYAVTVQKCTCIVEGIVYSPTESSRENEIESLKKLMGTNTKIFEIINAQLCFWDEYGDDEMLPDKHEIIDRVYETLNPIGLFADILKSGDKHKIGYACRRLADFDAFDYLNDIYELSKSGNRDISYNAAMALARLGYAEGVAEYILRIEKDEKYSSRIICELFDHFSCDRSELASLVFKNCDEYMKVVVIKAISPYGLHQFESIYSVGTASKNDEMRIACVKALGELADPKYEHTLLTAAKDKNWIVRSNAIKGLQKFATSAAIKGIKEALKDKEWWVRQTAANALIDMNVSISEIEDVLSGYDKYASDAVKYALYRSIDMNEE